MYVYSRRFKSRPYPQGTLTTPGTTWDRTLQYTHRSWCVAENLQDQNRRPRLLCLNTIATAKFSNNLETLEIYLSWGKQFFYNLSTFSI
jgi:hypothetical protein